MLSVFYAVTEGADEASARYPGRSKKPGSAFAVSLLAHAVREVRGIALPDIAVNENGKPYFPRLPELCFSYAHTKGLVLCAVSDAEVGADAERIRPVSARLAARFPGEDFFAAWTRMESVIKLNGAGGAPFCRHYALENCAACVCSRCHMPPEEITRVEIRAICT